MKRIAALAACLLAGAALLLPAFAGALTATGPENDPAGREWENHLFFRRMEEKTGIPVEGHAIQDGKAWTETLTALQGGAAAADVLLKADLTRTQEEALLDSGAILDLAPYIDTAMPNLCAILSEHPEWRARMTLQDGRIASLPQLNPVPQQAAVWINAAWLEALGLAMPGTPEELGAALTAFLAGDPDGNGKQNETVGLLGMWELRWLLPYFGVYADDWLMESGGEDGPVFAPETDGYRAFIETMASWYRNGILPPETFTDLHAGQYAYGENASDARLPGLIVSVNPVTHVPAERVTDYAVLLMPHAGKTAWRRFSDGVWTGCFAVTSACRDPEQALRWADALYTEDGFRLALAGEEGADWAWTEEGTWAFLLDGGRTVEDLRRNALMETGIGMPGLYPAEFAAKVDSAADRRVMSENARAAEAAANAPDAADAGRLPAETREEAAQLASSLLRMEEEGAAAFITGAVPLTDGNWEAWLSGMRAAGSGRLAELLAPAFGQPR